MATSKRPFRKILSTELSKKESITKVKTLLKAQVTLTKDNFKPGNVIFTGYDAKDKQVTYDRTPLILILAVSWRYTLGINFHWLPVVYRMMLIKAIKVKNAKNIRLGLPLEFSYRELKPMLKKLGYAPCIRLYINSRIAKRGTVIDPRELEKIARIKSQTFTNGRYSAEQLFKMAKERANERLKGR